MSCEVICVVRNGPARGVYPARFITFLRETSPTSLLTLSFFLFLFLFFWFLMVPGPSHWPGASWPGRDLVLHMTPPYCVWPHDRSSIRAKSIGSMPEGLRPNVRGFKEARRLVAQDLPMEARR
jgi:hypothetical protein